MAIGTVKWFNTGSGYGFITADDGGADLFVHRTSLGGDLRSTMTEGDRVEFDPRDAGMGREAINVFAMTPNGIALTGPPVSRPSGFAAPGATEASRG